jgi:hypothetical protein
MAAYQIQNYQLGWNTAKGNSEDAFSVMISSKQKQGWRKVTVKDAAEFAAIAAILQGNLPVYENQAGYIGNDDKI